jgi:guanylate kinase
LNDIGCLYILAAPSGAGKTSLVRGLIESDNRVVVSVSHTTRSPRPGDVDGVDYHFVSLQEFNQSIENKVFIEHAEVFGHHYGTSKEWVLETLQKGFDIILEIDWQGARQIRQLFVGARSIYILPPSLAVLTERLQRRAQDTEDVIHARMLQAQSEISHAHEFDYLIVNDDFNTALAQLKAIIKANRLKIGRQMKNHQKLLAKLTQNS